MHIYLRQKKKYNVVQVIPLVKKKNLPQIENKQSLFVFIIIYSFILIVGGVFGHKSQLKAAIIPSAISGVILILSCWFILHDKKPVLLFNLFFVLGLALFFTYRWFLIKKFYPPVFLALISFFLIFRLWKSLTKSKG